MSNPAPKTPPPDQPQRQRALDPASSVLVQAPAGSGKTDLLTRRFLRLLTEVEDPAQIVAITFTKAAAAEMRHRILAELEAAATRSEGGGGFTPRKLAPELTRALVPGETGYSVKDTGSSVKGTGFSPYIDQPETNRALAPEGNPAPFSMESLARRAWTHSNALAWNLLDQPAQLRISTIDSFCRDLALQQPLLSGLGDGLGIYEQPEELYRRAARQALEQIDGSDPALRAAAEALLLWRDNNWQEMENLLVEMLQSRDRWMHDFVLEREQDWEALRARLEQPFAKATGQSLTGLSRLLDQVPGCRDQALALARFACGQGAAQFQPLAELPGFPADPADFGSPEEARSAYICLGTLLLANDGSFRKAVDKRLGFPADRKREKAQLLGLIARLAAIPGLGSALDAVRSLPPARYTDEDWQIVRACFTLLRNAAAQLKVVFAEAGAVDYIEVAQIALNVLRGPDGQPSDAAIAVADGIRHILVDEFQDTSRRQHELLRRLIAAWPGREGRGCFVVGDPMQSIYFFRDADAELFPRVRQAGLEIPGADPLLFDPIGLTSNFRTAKPLVEKLNEIFTLVFAENDGSGVTFTPAKPARNDSRTDAGAPADVGAPGPSPLGTRDSNPTGPKSNFELPINFSSQTTKTMNTITTPQGTGAPGPSPLGTRETPAPPTPELLPEGAAENSQWQVRLGGRSPGKTAELMSPSPVGASEAPPNPRSTFELHVNFTAQTSRNTASLDNNPHPPQTTDIVALIRSHLPRIEHARATGEKYRVAVLGRTRNTLAPIARALREADIPFRAVDLEKLSARPEVLDALALARAILNPLDRVAWLGVLRAPWCGLSLADLHTLTSADDPSLLARPIPELLAERRHLLSQEGRTSAERMIDVFAAVPALRFAQPTASLGTWLRQVWLRLGGPQCAGRTALANLDLLWQSLDSLPNGEPDLLSPALDAALEDLTAQPDPETSGECGVQLMTIHKSKGLEFEVVIVPDLQAGSNLGKPRLLSWLERGLPPEDGPNGPDGSEEITEFLVAPLQPKGADRGSAKLWVDRVYRQRESQETRRLLYVAATRAREELHLFARPACKQDKNGAWSLAEPKDSLLATAWPALQAEIQQRFDEWKSTLAEPESEPATIDSLAASAETNLLAMSAPIKPTLLRRLPPGYCPAKATNSSFTESSVEAEMAGAPSIERSLLDGWETTKAGAPGPSPLGTGESDLYQRHEGGLLSRALGTAVHSLLEALAGLRKSHDWDQARAALKRHHPRIAAQIRAAGIDPAKASTLAAEALSLAVAASNDPAGAWILSPHAKEASEVRWTGIVAGGLRTVQVDRLFRAGLTPLSTGDEAWWIVDYKTAHADMPDPTAALPGLRKLFAPQLETYAQVLRNLHGTAAPIRAALYYPRMLLFDWWEI